MTDFLSLNKTSTTSVIAVLIILLGFLLLFCMYFIPTGIDDALKTQLIQGDWNIMMVAALYYFGQSKQRTTTATTVDNVEKMEVNNTSETDTNK